MSAAFASTCALVGGGLVYTRVVAKAVGPGATRLLLFAPALCVNVAAPLLVLDPEADPLFTAIGVATFAWWTNFKVLALAAGRGQLAHPTLSAPAFLALAALPVRLADGRGGRTPRGDSDRNRTRVREHHRRADAPHTARDAFLGFACKLAALRCCVSIALPALDARHVGTHQAGAHVDRAVRRVQVLTVARNATYAVALYAFLGALFDLGAALAFAAFGAPLARHFDLPFLATSFSDFWGSRWNLVAGASLRDAVYAPITEGRFFRDADGRVSAPNAEAAGARGEEGKTAAASRVARRDEDARARRRRFVGVFACFAVSGAMHEFVLWALEGRSSRPGSRAIGWEWFAFFFAQAPLVCLEAFFSSSKTRRRRREKSKPSSPTPKPRGVFSSMTTASSTRAVKNGAFLVAQLALANALFFPPVARHALDERIVADVRKVLGFQTP